MDGRSRARLAATAAVWLGCACSEPPPYTFFDACDPDAAPDAECYAAKRDPASADVALATALAHRYMDEHRAEGHAWDWGDSVLMYALTELARVTGDARVRAYYRAWMDHHLEAGYTLTWSDSCPPALTAIALYAETGDERYAAVPRDVMRYLDETALRTAEGGISHLGQIPVRTLWADSLFMFGMVLARWGEATDDVRPLVEMYRQLGVFSERMQDEGGLFRHSDGWPGEHDDAHWARGNAWVIVGAVDYMRVRTLRHERDARATAALGAQVAAVLGAQDPATGGWHTILDRPDTYYETTANGLFAYGLARGYRYGVLGPEVLGPAARARDAVRAAVVRDEAGRPVVTGISGPTVVGTYAQYAAVELVDDLHYGVGAAILALIEGSGLPAGAEP